MSVAVVWLLVCVALVENSCLRHVLWTVLKFIKKKRFL